MKATSSKCFEVLQCLPSHCSKCSSARDRPKVHWTERSRSFPTLVHHDVQNSMILLLTNVQVILRLHEFLLLLLLGRCQSTLPDILYPHPPSSLSLTSFFIQDWDLTLFAPSSVRNNPDHPWGLRRHTHFHTSEIYYSAILIDLMLRCTWSFKLSPHLDHFNDLEGSIFIMEFLEVLRRT